MRVTPSLWSSTSPSNRFFRSTRRAASIVAGRVRIAWGAPVCTTRPWFRRHMVGEAGGLVEIMGDEHDRNRQRAPEVGQFTVETAAGGLVDGREREGVV